VGTTHLWDAKARIGVAGDWCTGHRVEDAFLSGLSLALAVA
jgi:renalase